MERCIGNESFKDTGLAYTLKLIKGKYKMRVLYTLMEFGAVRFGEMKRYLGEISFFMLNRTLKELEADNLIKRKEYDQLPLKVEYSLTERGTSLIPLLDGLCAWGDAHKP
ncbi:MAG: helix-turn-helix transcriptional regulator [Selenomonadaceae bacterium]|nr:helix-turn-helix transcriptional regulator [Selenomonadaceae bacterium]MBQ6132036.1 helix-turn-helix transcriptional regulator [Selenomonadaceae bacterium]